MKITKKRRNIIFTALAAALIILAAASMIIGRYSISIGELPGLLKSLFSGTEPADSSAYTVLFQSRIPRIIAAGLIGCGLSVSGASYQGVFRNPMVSPDLLGASAGAGFGAALGLLWGTPQIVVQVMAFALGILAVVCALGLSRAAGREQDNSRLILVLCGIVVGALFQAFISIVKYVADPFDTMPSISFWLMGGLTYVTASDILILLVPVTIGVTILMLLRWKLNLLAFGDDEASAMGVSVVKYRIIVIGCATLMTAASVAVGGMIGWVGLIVPHFARIMVGPDYRRMLPCAALLGAIFMIVVDTIARCAFAQELPIGILTAIIGAPVFAVLFLKGKKGFI